jgi:CheY-like chemotaxis protein
MHPDVPVIFYSGDDFLSDETEGSKARAQDYVSKPDIDRLLDAVNQFLAA